MNHVKYIALLYAIIAAALPGCQNDSVAPLDPAKAILGKWEIIEIGNWPNMKPVHDPLAYAEYLPDSIMREYEYKTQKYFYKKYWIDDSLLYESIPRGDGYSLTIRYEYDFFDNNNKLRLDFHQTTAIFKTSIHKRIK